MPATIELTRRAQADLAELETYLEREAGARTMRRIVRQIRDHIDRLAEFPELGPVKEELGVDRRVLVARPFVVIYRFRDDRAVVLRIVHGARDLPALLGDS